MKNKLKEKKMIKTECHFCGKSLIAPNKIDGMKIRINTTLFCSEKCMENHEDEEGIIIKNGKWGRVTLKEVL